MVNLEPHKSARFLLLGTVRNNYRNNKTSGKNIVLARDPAAQRMFSVRKRSVNVATAQMFSVAKAKRQLQMF